MLASVRIGAIHSVVFGGFAAASLATRIDDARPKVHRHRRRRHARRQGRSRTSLWSTTRCGSPSIRRQHLIVVDRGLDATPAQASGRDLDYATLAATARWRERALRVARIVRAVVHPLHLGHDRQAEGRAARHRRLRGRAGGVDARHLLRRARARRCSRPATSAGSSATRTSSTGRCSTARRRSCTKACRSAPTRRSGGRSSSDYGVRTMFSSPTAIRVLKKQDPSFMKKHDLSSLHYLFLAGEPLDEPTARWASDALGVAIVDNYWQTESGWPILSAQPGIEDTPRKFGSPSFRIVRLRRAAARRGTGEEVGSRPERRAGDRAAAAAGLHDARSGATTSASSRRISRRSPAAGLFDVRLGDARRRRLLLRARPHRRRDQRRRAPPRHARDRGSGAGACRHRRSRGGRRRRRDQGPGAGRVRGGRRTLRASAAPTAAARDAAGSDGHRRPRARRDRAARRRCISSPCCPRRARASCCAARSRRLAEGRDPGDLTTIEDPAALESIRNVLAHDETARCAAVVLRHDCGRTVRARARYPGRRGRQRALRLGRGRRSPADSSSTRRAIPNSSPPRAARSSRCRRCRSWRRAAIERFGLFAAASGAAVREPFGRAASRRRRRPTCSRARAAVRRAAAMRCAPPVVLHRSRPTASGGRRLFAAAAQLLRQAHRHARVLSPMRRADR